MEYTKLRPLPLSLSLALVAVSETITAAPGRPQQGIAVIGKPTTTRVVLDNWAYFKRLPSLTVGPSDRKWIPIGGT